MSVEKPNVLLHKGIYKALSLCFKDFNGGLVLSLAVLGTI